MKERNSKKKMWLSLGLAGALTVGATLALFTDVTGTLTNNFNIFNGAGGKGISLEIKEHDVSSANDYEYTDGDEWINGDDLGTAGVTYNELVSYQVIDKDPTVFMHENSVESMVVLEVTGLNQDTKIKTYKETEDTDINENGLSSEWTKINVTGTNVDSTKTYFIYRYNPEASYDTANPSVANYDMLPPIFRHLQVQNVADGTTFTPITAKAAAAQVENTDEKTAVLEALKTLGVTATNYTKVN